MMKARSSRLALLIVSLAFMSACDASAAEPPSGLLCNLLSHPEKTLITDPKPDFSWIVSSSIKDDVQSACQILVATSREKLVAQIGDAWDSGKVISARSINVEWAVNPLSPHTSYWWAVRTWDRLGEVSAYSIPQRFNTGEFGTARRWPTESRWVTLPDEAEGEAWTFEDRHPVAYHPIPPSKTVKSADGSIFLDFGRAAFSTLKLNAGLNPSSRERPRVKSKSLSGKRTTGTRSMQNPAAALFTGSIQ